MGRPGAGRAGVGADAWPTAGSSRAGRCCGRFAVARRRLRGRCPAGSPGSRPTADDQLDQQPDGASARTPGCWPPSPRSRPASGCSRGPAVDGHRARRSMSSRAAENLFWLGRYAERAEDLGAPAAGRVRPPQRLRPRRNPAGTECLDGLLAALTHVTATYPGLRRRRRRRAPRRARARAARPRSSTPHRPGSLAFSVPPPARRRGPGARPALERHVARLGHLERDLAALDAQPRPSRPCTGVARPGDGRACWPWRASSAESMVRDPGWRFMDAGRRLERALQLAAARAPPSCPCATRPPTASCSSRC